MNWRIARLVLSLPAIPCFVLAALSAEVTFLPRPRIIASSPAHPGNYAVENLFDNNPATEYSCAGPGTGPFVDVDFGAPTQIGGFMHLDRRDGISQIHGASLVFSDRPDFAEAATTITLQSVPGGATWQTFRAP